MIANSWIVAAIAVALIAAVCMFFIARGRRRAQAEFRALDDLDTVMGWTPEATRVMSSTERRAHRMLIEALPEHTVLAQVSLARFLKVPKRRSYGEWLGRVGYLSADLLVCDRSSNVLTVIEIHSSRDSLRSRERHERMTRVLKAAGIRVIRWNEDEIPSPELARAQILAQASESAPAPLRPSSSSYRLTDLPVAEASELNLDDESHPTREPTPSTWFDDFDSTGSSQLERDKR
jgi:hypothetical protein